MPKFDEIFQAQAGVRDEFDCDGDAVFKAFGGGKPCSVCGADGFKSGF
jgi:hypothetical protein